MLDATTRIIKQRIAADPYAFYGALIALGRRGRDYWGARCCFHSDSNPSLVVYDSGLYKCYGCDASGDGIDFVRRLERLSFPEALERAARLVGDACLPTAAQKSVTDPQLPAPPPASIPLGTVDECHQRLMRSDAVIAWLERERCWPRGMLGEFRLGLSDHWGKPARITVPVRSASGPRDQFVDLRGYLPGNYPDRPPRAPKFLPWSNGRRPALFPPWGWLRGTGTVVCCEGEPDAIALISHGVPALTCTNGAGAWAKVALPDLTGVTAVVLGDADVAGDRMGEVLEARLAAAGAERVVRKRWPASLPDGRPVPPKTDATDVLRWFGAEVALSWLELL